MKNLALTFTFAALSACGTPAFTSAMRPSGFGDVPTSVQCDGVDRDARVITGVSARRSRDGWRLVYISEYTSSALPDMPVMLCWEQPNSGGAQARR